MQTSIGQNLLRSMLYAKASKDNNINSSEATDKQTEEIILDNDGINLLNKIQANLYEVTGNKIISSQNLGVYTAFISSSKGTKHTVNNSNAVQNHNNINTAFEEDDDILIDDKLAELSETSVDTLNKKTNQAEGVGNKKIDKETGNVLEQTKIDENGTVRHYSYEYYEGTKTVKTLKIINESLNTESYRQYDKNGKLTQKTVYKKDENGNVEKTIVSSYDQNGNITKIVTKDENGKVIREEKILKIKKDENGNIIQKDTQDKDGTVRHYTYEYYEGTNTTKSLKVINESLNTESYRKYDESGKLTKKTVYQKDDNGNTKSTVITSYDENGEMSQRIEKDKSGKIIQKDTIEADGVLRHYSYEYYEGTKTVKTLKIINDGLNTESYRQYDKSGKLYEKTIYQKDDNGDIKNTYVSLYDDNGELTKKIKKDENGNVIKKDTKDEDGVVRHYSYQYYEGTNTVKTLRVINENLNTESYRQYDKNGNLYEKTLHQKDNDGNIEKTTISSYDKNDKVIKKQIIETNSAGEKDVFTYNYLEFEGDYPTKYSVEYNYANGAHTKSTIEQRKLNSTNKNDYIVSAVNEQFINGEWLLVSELNTTTKEDSEGNMKEGTDRTFYFYDENNKLIKKEETFSFNSAMPTDDNKALSTNSLYQLDQKLVTTYDANTGGVTSTVTYTKKNIITTFYDENGVETGTKVQTYKENDYENHNLNNISREDFVKEAEKYIGYNRIDGSYSVFGTNGSACATFATYVMYQLGFDLTSVKSRTTYMLQNQAINEGRHIDAKDAFSQLEAGADIDDLIKPGDILTKMKEDGSNSHTTIVKSAKYDKKTGEIILQVIGYESNANNENNGVKEAKYVITQNKKGNIEINGKEYCVGFCDYLS
ncbi:MAG: hypothetical protein IJY61_03760 [Candidatus Gastranaerophilales bacterium]|nr:hypothetical protein [Candidatus Gastranaerophilales bacterium]